MSDQGVGKKEIPITMNRNERTKLGIKLKIKYGIKEMCTREGAVFYPEEMYKVLIYLEQLEKEKASLEDLFKLYANYMRTANYFQMADRMMRDLSQLGDGGNDKSKCSCPPKKNDGSAFDGVSYYCPIHGR